MINYEGGEFEIRFRMKKKLVLEEWEIRKVKENQLC